ncbi:hypothetical protein [Clostridium sp.]|jgi:hypothetical protein|uniref:hypothetical protein n=1 Tax=Clostridium sp. TaxID=1506 RepID=UPI00204B1AE2|nr:hypothetical protein [Clostridium celatum]DAE72714.1 MAG TPA: hypothetical protein [Caudoviricetes sp.]DAU94910.1 MAG TPA: hypothetical protein [Caudoviricetes sp.]
MNIVEYYDGITIKDENKEYKLTKRVSAPDTLFLYFKSIEKVIDEEKESLKNKISELDEVVENLMITLMDIVP